MHKSSRRAKPYIAKRSLPRRHNVQEIEKLILRELGLNARAPSREIADTLRLKGVKISQRAVRKRIEKMEKDKTILRYTAILNPAKLESRMRKILLINLKSSPRFETKLQEMSDYFKRNPNCVFSARLGGDIDWIACMAFPPGVEGKMEGDKLRSMFSDIIDDLRAYEVDVVKEGYNEDVWLMT